MKYEMWILLLYAAYLFLLSVVAFALYGKDKKMAKATADREDGVGRIKERTLLGIAAFGGALGAFLGRMVFRHKTRKGYFSLVILFSLLVQAAVLVLLAVLAVR